MDLEDLEVVMIIAMSAYFSFIRDKMIHIFMYNFFYFLFIEHVFCKQAGSQTIARQHPGYPILVFYIYT